MTEEELKRIARTEVDRLKGEIARRDAEIARLKKWNKWFFYRVKFMRQCQTEYYRLRQTTKSSMVDECQKVMAADAAREMLAKSKELEREVDEEIRSIDNSVSRQETIGQLKESFGDLEEVDLAKSSHMRQQSIRTNNYWEKQ